MLLSARLANDAKRQVEAPITAVHHGICLIKMICLRSNIQILPSGANYVPCVCVHHRRGDTEAQRQCLLSEKQRRSAVVILGVSIIKFYLISFECLHTEVSS